MILGPRTQRTILVACFVPVGMLYLIAWLAPAIGLFHDDAVYLVTAKAIAAGHGYTIESLPHPIPQTKYPPLLPAVLTLFTLVSTQAQWLKLLPLACAAGWLAVMFRLLRKMGASPNGALVLILLTALSPLVLFLGTNLLSEMPFALLVAAALLMLLEEQALAAGILAGLATLTRSAGVALVIACVIVFAARRRFRSAIVFAAAAMVLIAPWFGWSLAHVGGDTYYTSASNYASFNILTALPASDKVVVFTHNLVSLLAGPFSLLTGITSMYALVATVLVMSYCLFRRRQLVPDLFVGIYCLMLLCWTWPPERFVAPVLPLILWMVWRVLGNVRLREAMAACLIIIAAVSVYTDAQRIAVAWRSGAFPFAAAANDNWYDLENLFRYIRANVPADSIIAADLDPLIYLNTGRKTIRGFAPDGFGLFYASPQRAVTPDELWKNILEAGADYVVLMPDRNFAESSSYHRSAEALEHGGVLQPVFMEGVEREYRLLRVTR